MLAIASLRRRLIILVLVVIVASEIFLWLRGLQRRLSLERLQAIDQSRIALLRYVQIHRHCSEEKAYHRIATFVKNHVPPEDRAAIVNMVIYDRQRLLADAQRILAQNPDEIDDI